MRKLLFQSDDYGLTDSVADGLLKGIDQQYGLVCQHAQLRPGCGENS